MVIGSLMETALPAFEQALFDKTRPSLASMTNGTNADTAANVPVNIAPAAID